MYYVYHTLILSPPIHRERLRGKIGGTVWATLNSEKAIFQRVISIYIDEHTRDEESDNTDTYNYSNMMKKSEHMCTEGVDQCNINSGDGKLMNTSFQSIVNPELLQYPSEPGFYTINKFHPGLRVVHAEPWIFEIEDFITPKEAEHIHQACGSHQLQPATSHNGDTMTKWEYQMLRTNPRRCAPMLEERIASLTNGLNFDHVEHGGIISYWAGSKGLPAHLDGLGPVHGHPRVISMFIYLTPVSDVTGGTYFNNSKVTVAPKQGKVVLFFPGDQNGREDDRLLHSGLPTKDEKQIYRFFFYARPVFKGKHLPDGPIDYP